ncbi:hypothetical protein TCDM_08651 [Trypanosoma cruzi Dm28c]|uniref:Uncharacterized protein n=1 Tax=Trypanosoma cruzi Dm28c TaxID=1416333 RepID=V5BGC5_TRYCR|nr:hypothetical protein TCDM_08651 [Trypanosoma cruzi Dm28c]
MGKRRHRSRFREMLLLMDCAASVTLLGYPTTTIVLLMLSSELLPGTLQAATRRASSGHGTPRPPWTVSDDRPLKRPATLWDRMTQAAGRTACCLSLSMHLDPLHYYAAPQR